ncbi:MAG: hypothetical protein IKZ96_04055 [Bacilli bacterium]|nr:hypothetical protein [Bacilli bacterium]
MKKYILLIITCLLVLFPLTVKAEDFSEKVDKSSKKEAIKACETGDAGSYYCYRYTFLPGVHPMYNTTVWTNKTLGCGFEKTDWDYESCKSSNLSVTYKQCKNDYCRTITHSGFNGTPDFYDFSEKKSGNVTCSNVKPFHIIYKTATIMAPILTILFATFDLVASIMSGDTKKMSKFRSKLTRRIIALFILMVLPILISILVDTLSKNSAIKDSSLLKCVVTGKE